MSRRNREKRAAKQKNRRRESSGRPRSAFDPGEDRALLLERLVWALSEVASCPDHDIPRRTAQFVDGYRGRDLDIAADLVVHEAIRTAWEHGWLPCDLHEIASRQLESTAVRYLDEAIVLESRQYAVATLHPKWRADLVGISATVDAATQEPQMSRWAASNALDRHEALGVVVKVLNLLGRLPALELLLPLPGAHEHIQTAVTHVDARALEKVRALLTKAEATAFAAEAEALSAKAQELMSRYSLREAVAEHDRRRSPEAAVRRIWIDNPYVAAKVSLVQAVGNANRCRLVWSERLGFVTVVGSGTDLEFVELLATSLLVQANRAMLAAGRQDSGGARTRTRSFRQSFLVAYAQRIGERLAQTNAVVTAEAGQDRRLLPVLAATSRATDELIDRMFQSMVHRAVSATNGAGWGAGRAAADMAVLDVRDALAG